MKAVSNPSVSVNSRCAGSALLLAALCWAGTCRPASADSIRLRNWEGNDDYIEFFRQGFVAEGRIGSAATPDHNHTFEVDVGHTTAAPVSQADLAWQNGNTHDFTLEYNAETKEVKFTVDGSSGSGGETEVTVSFTAAWDESEGLPDALFLRARATEPGSKIILSMLRIKVGTMVDFVSIDGSAQAMGTDGRNSLQVMGLDLREGFVLKGSSQWYWDASWHELFLPRHSQLSFQLMVGDWDYAVSMDLDVDGDLDVTGPDDGAERYLSGYGPSSPRGENWEPKLSSGAFSGGTFSPHKINLVVDGPGVGSAFDDVQFFIVETSSHPGYAMNGISALVTGEGKNGDFSFAATSNLAVYSSKDGATKTDNKCWAPIYAKDYGGHATVVAVGFRTDETEGTYLASLTFPVDRDADDLPDVWEMQQIADWNTLFHATVSAGDFTFFSGVSDRELADPDGPDPLPSHKTAGDSLTAWQEYRGYVLDGGSLGGTSFSPLNHHRLSAASKELLVELDIMAEMDGDERFPTQRAIEEVTLRGIADAYFQQAGVVMHWVKDQSAARLLEVVDANRVDLELVKYGLEQRSDNPGLNEFVHLMFMKDYPQHLVLGKAGGVGAFVFLENISKRIVIMRGELGTHLLSNAT